MKLLLITAALLLGASPALAGNSSSSSSNSSSSSYAGNSNRQSTSFNERYQAPGVGSTGLTSTGVCPIGSFGFGISGPGAGISFGMTKGDKECRIAYLMQQAGYGRQALRNYLEASVPEIAAAVQRPVATARYAKTTRVAASAGPDAGCKQWLFGNVGGTCVRH